MDGLVRRQSVIAFRLQREVHHHDAVLLDDADQQDDADQRDHAQVVAAGHQDQQRADAGRWQRRQDRQRVDVALVQQTQHDVDGDQRRGDQPRLRRERIAERLRRALEGAGQRLRRADARHRLVDRIDGLSQRHARREVERQRHRRVLALVVDGQIGCLVRIHRDESRQGHLPPGGRGHDEELAEQVGVRLHPRRDFQHHVVRVDLGVVLRHLALADGVVQEWNRIPWRA